MRNAILSCLKRRRFTSTYITADTRPWRNFTLTDRQYVVIRRIHYGYAASLYLFRRSFSTDCSSVHGGRPSSEYAKLRKEALEIKFGRILGTQRTRSVSMLGQLGPFLALYRAVIISFQVFKLTMCRLFVHDIEKRAIKFRETLISLGPFYIKLGQALSTRPDILPAVYCQELAKLQDQIPPFPTHVALKCIERELGVPVSQIFSDISKEPVAAASLGQVYKVVQLTCILESL